MSDPHTSTLGPEVEAVLLRFEECWENGGRPGVSTFWREGDPVSLLSELLHIDLERRLNSGLPVSVDAYFLEFPALAERTDLAVNLIEAEYDLRLRKGDAPSWADYLGRFGAYRVELLKRRPLEWSGCRSPGSDPSETVATSPGDGGSTGNDQRTWPEVPGYEVLDVLGRGGMGVVYLARQVKLNRLVALKMILAGDHADLAHRQRFLAEARAAARLQHPHIVQVHEIGEHNGLPYFSVEYQRAGSLQQRLRGQPQPPRDAARFVEVLARAVHVAHENGVIHRDLKPANILLQFADSTPQVDRSMDRSQSSPLSAIFELQAAVPKIPDFGLAKLSDDAQEQTGSDVIMGTPSYMAPEQAEGRARDAGPAVDVYALGAILYELLTGRPPFRGTTVLDTLQQVREVEPVPPSRLAGRIPTDLETICLKCLSKDPVRRYATARDMAEDLASFLAGRPIQARPIGRAERCWRWCKRNPAQAAVAGLAIAVASLAFVLVAVSRQHAMQLANEKSNQAVEEEKLRRHAERESARMLLEQSLAKCRLEDAGAGMHWLGRSLERAIEVGDADLEAEIRLQLAMWAREVHALEEVWPHDDPVYAVAGSPDGRWLATRTRSSGKVHLWDTATRKLTKTLVGMQRGGRQVLAFSPDSRRLATAVLGGRVVLRDLPFLTPIGPMLAQESGVVSLAFSRDGKRLATGSPDKTARVWDLETGKLLPGSPMHHENEVEAVALNADGMVLITSTESPGNTIYRWDANTGQLLGRVSHTAPTWGLDSHPASDLFLSASMDLTLRQWDVRTGRQQGPTVRQQRGVYHGAFSRDGHMIASGSADYTARLWNQETGQAIGPAMFHGESVRSVAFSGDDKFLLTGSQDKNARLWRIGGSRPTRLFVDAPKDEPVRNGSEVALTPDGELLAFQANSRLKLWELASGRLVSSDTLGQMRQKIALQSLAISRDGRQLWAADRSQVQLHDLRIGKRRNTPAFLAQAVHPVALSPDDKTLATGFGKTGVRIWDLAAGKETAKLEHDDILARAVFSPHGRLLLTSSYDKTAKLWEVPSGRLLHTFSHSETVNAAAFSPDGKLAVTAGRDGAVRLWDIATGRQVGAPLVHTGSVAIAVFSPDGKQILVGNQNRHAYLWSVASRRLLGPPIPHPESVLGVAFFPDGKRFVTGCYDGKARLFDVPAPVAGASVQVKAWIESITGQELEADGSLRVLDAAEWRQRKLARP